jgi:SAM-dependent methyltransferase
MEQKAYKPVVAALINKWKPREVLDLGAGSGWLRTVVDPATILDGIDELITTLDGYRSLYQADLNRGIPPDLGLYDCVVACEVIAYLTNPGLFFSEIHRHLKPGGKVIVSTPNPWYPESRFHYFMRGFQLGFPSPIGKVGWEKRFHLIPWAFPQLYHFLRIHGFSEIRLHDVQEMKPKRVFEWLLGFPGWEYCRSKFRRAGCEEAAEYWCMVGSRQSLFGHRLVVTAAKNWAD